jgi:hypothetical protein
MIFKFRNKLISSPSHEIKIHVQIAGKWSVPSYLALLHLKFYNIVMKFYDIQILQ